MNILSLAWAHMWVQSYINSVDEDVCYLKPHYFHLLSTYNGNGLFCVSNSILGGGKATWHVREHETALSFFFFFESRKSHPLKNILCESRWAKWLELKICYAHLKLFAITLRWNSIIASTIITKVTFVIIKSILWIENFDATRESLRKKKKRG